MNVSRIISFICSAIIFISCNSSSSSGQNGSSFKKFPKEENVVFKDYINFPGKVNKIFLYDSLLIVRNSKMTLKDNFFYIYGLHQKKMLDSAFKVGSEANEILSPLATGLNKNMLWAYDISTSKILMDSVLPLADAAHQRNGKEFKVKTLLYAVQINDSLQMFANGEYKKAAKIQQIDLVTGKVIREFGKYDPAPDKMSPVSWRAAYESFLFIQPNYQKLVSAARFTDQIEVFDLKTFKSRVIKGPDHYEPQFDPMQAHGMDMISRNDKTRFAFVNGYATNKFIYLLYSGNNHMTEHLDYGRTIFVYDWEGNPFKKINLPSYISCFAVKDDKEVYVFDVKSNSIKMANINL